MPEEEDDVSDEGEAGSDSPEKRKIKHTVEAEEVPALLVLAGIFDLLSLFTFAAPFIAIVGKLTFIMIWLSHGVMPWSKKYWSWFVITFVCEFIPGVGLLPMFIVGELKMIGQSRIEDRLQRTTGLTQAAIQVAKFKLRKSLQNAARTADPEMLAEMQQRQKEFEAMQKSLKVFSARTLRRTVTNKMQGRDTKYQDSESIDMDGAQSRGQSTTSQNPANQNSRPDAFNGVNQQGEDETQTPLSLPVSTTSSDDVSLSYTPDDPSSGGGQAGVENQVLSPSFGKGTDGQLISANDNQGGRSSPSSSTSSGPTEPPERMAA